MSPSQKVVRQSFVGREHRKRKISLCSKNKRKANRVHWPVRCTGQSGTLAYQVNWPIRCTSQSGVLANQVNWPIRYTDLLGVLVYQVQRPIRYTDPLSNRELPRKEA